MDRTTLPLPDNVTYSDIFNIPEENKDAQGSSTVDYDKCARVIRPMEYPVVNETGGNRFGSGMIRKLFAPDTRPGWAMNPYNILCV